MTSMTSMTSMGTGIVYRTQMPEHLVELLEKAKAVAVENGSRAYVRSDDFEITLTRPAQCFIEMEVFPGGRVHWFGALKR